MPHGSSISPPGAFCSMPPGVRHEVSNPSKTDEAFDDAELFVAADASQATRL
jgi:hypothetical protein